MLALHNFEAPICPVMAEIDPQVSTPTEALVDPIPLCTEEITDEALELVGR